LIELLVVIAVIAILATIGLVSLNGARESARDATRKADISHLRTALALYFDEYDQYPMPVGNSGNGPDVSTTALDGTIFSQNNNPIFPRYLSRTLVDPMNNYGAGLYYYYDTNQKINHRGYVLCFRKEGGQLPRYFYYNTGVYGGGSVCPVLPSP